jgi:oxygen-independent coproporphyrinogen-3 oxidase
VDLDAANVCQYEISNFARSGFLSRHNLKYWKRLPYVGLGVDAHSMLPCANDEWESVRFSTADSLEQYVAGAPVARTAVSVQSALEETFFLGLRVTEGVNLADVRTRFGNSFVDAFDPTLAELSDGELIDRSGDRIRLTPRGRLVSNEVFERFLGEQSTR